MTTFIDFVPNSAEPFSFQPTFDGIVYNASVRWNLFGQRWYVNVFDLTGNLVFSLPLIGSPSAIPIQSLAWDPLEQVVDVVTAGPHGYTMNDTIDLTITDCAPDVFNGEVAALITGDASFTYPMKADPGVATLIGSAEYNINLAGGYFHISTLVFREDNQRFEVTP